MPKRMAQAKATPNLPRFTRMTRNNQLTLPRPLADARGVGAGSLFQVDAVPEGFLFRPLTVTPDPDRQAYLDAKAGKGLSPIFNSAAEGIAHLRKSVARKRGKK